MFPLKKELKFILEINQLQTSFKLTQSVGLWSVLYLFDDLTLQQYLEKHLH